jgi:uncharacterized membrane protein YqiK
MDYPGFTGRLILGAIAVIVIVVALVAEWIGRRYEAPTMRRRVNAASDDYLADRGTVWQAAIREARRLFRPRV